MIIPVGRLAIDAFYAPSKTVEEIGTHMGHTGAQVIPLAVITSLLLALKGRLHSAIRNMSTEVWPYSLPSLLQ